MDSEVKENQDLLKRITDWSLDTSAQSSAPKRRKMNDSSFTTPTLILTFMYYLESWSISISPMRNLSYLYDVAFRLVNTKSPTNRAYIQLHHDTNVLPSSDTILISTRLKHNSIITIGLVAATPSPRQFFPDFCSRCLIKVYNTFDGPPLYSYWEPLDTSALVFSILFRYSQISQEELGIYLNSTQLSRLTTITPAKGLDDCVVRLTHIHIWRPLRDVIRQHTTSGWLGRDPIIVPPSNREGATKWFIQLNS